MLLVLILEWRKGVIQMLDIREQGWELEGGWRTGTSLEEKCNNYHDIKDIVCV
jgi:hypothetical protein